MDHRVLERWRAVVDDDVPDGDVVVATWWETAEWVNALHPSKGAKVYFVQHHEVFSYLPVKRCRATYRFPMHKVVVAEWLKELMISEYGDSIVDLVPNSVDHSQFFSDSRGKQPVPTVGFLYSTIPFKGLDVVFAAINLLRGQFKNLRLISFGSQSPSGSNALPPNTDFFFRPAQSKIRSLYAQCDVWVTASRSEGFNLPAMEAMACRTPVVATRTGWPAEAFENSENGVLADIDDIAGVARGIEWVLSLPDTEWRKLSANAYNTVARTSWVDSVQKFERALQHACKRALNGEIPGSSPAHAAVFATD